MQKNVFIKEGIIDSENQRVFLVNSTNKEVTLYKGSTIGIIKDIKEIDGEIQKIRKKKNQKSAKKLTK